MSYIGNQPTSVAFLTDTFSGTGLATAFTMQVAPATTSSILVAITGVVQDPSTYSVVGTTLTFSQAPPVGTSNISVRYMGIPASGVTTTAYRTVTNFTATGGQTTFSVPSYTVGYVDVYRNGVRLAAADYTATNGTTVVLANAATSGDSVVTESFYVSSVLNAIPAVAGAVNSTYITDGAVTQAKLGANVAGNGPTFSAYANTNQTISNVTWTKVQFQTEEWDTNSNFNNTGSTVGSTPAYAFLPTVAGYYQLNANITIQGSTTGNLILDLYKNGSPYRQGTQVIAEAAGAVVSTIVYANGTTDYFEVFVYQGGGVSKSLYGIYPYNLFTAALVRAA